MAHKIKSKDDRNLVFIEKKEDETSAVIALRVLNMYDQDFNLTIKDICSILLCDRQWVVKNVKDNVKHIFLNADYRRFLKLIAKDYDYSDINLKDYYYFSRKDFYKWLKRNTVATRQTIVVSVKAFCVDKVLFKKITDEYYEEIREARNIYSNIVANMEYQDKIYETLSEQGKEVFSKRLGVTNRDETKAVVIKSFDIPELISIKELRNEVYDKKSLEIIYRDLYRYGAIKYTIANSLVRYDANFFSIDMVCYKTDPDYLITIPYEVFLKL